MSAATYQHKGAKRIIIRLDNGSLIGDKGTLLRQADASGVVLLDPQRALECNRLGQPDIDRLRKLVEQSTPPPPPPVPVAPAAPVANGYPAAAPPVKREVGRCARCGQAGPDPPAGRRPALHSAGCSDWRVGGAACAPRAATIHSNHPAPPAARTAPQQEAADVGGRRASRCGW